MLALTLALISTSRRLTTPVARHASFSSSISTPFVHWNSTTCLHPDTLTFKEVFLTPGLPRHRQQRIRRLHRSLSEPVRDVATAASRRAHDAWHKICSSWARRALVLKQLVLLPARRVWRRVISRGLHREIGREPHARAVREVHKQAPARSDGGAATAIKLRVNVIDRHTRTGIRVKRPVRPLRKRRARTSRHLGRESRTHAVVHAVQGLLKIILRRLQLVLHKACVRPLLRVMVPVVRIVKVVLRPLRLLRWFERMRRWCRRGLKALRTSWCKQIFIFTLFVMTVVSAFLALCPMLFSRGSRLPLVYYRSRTEADGVPC